MRKKEKIYEDGEYSPDKECEICKSRGIKEKRITAYNKKHDAFLCSEHDYYIEEIIKGQY
jgi:hypothetical protein